MAKEDLLKSIKQLSASDQKWLAGQLNKKETVSPHDGVAEAVYQDIWHKISKERPKTMLSPWMSLPKTKKSDFIVAFRAAKDELESMGLRKAGTLIPALVAYHSITGTVSFDGIISGLKQIKILFFAQFPDYNEGAILLLAKALDGFDILAPLPSNSLYDEEDEEDEWK